MLPLTNEQQELFEKAKNLKINYVKKYRRVIDYTAKERGATHSIFNLKYSIPKENLVVLHIGMTTLS